MADQAPGGRPTDREHLVAAARQQILAGECLRTAAPPPGFASHPGNRHAEVAGVPVTAWAIDQPWAAQATLTQVPAADLVDTAAEVLRWYAAYAHPGQGDLEVDEQQAAVLADQLGLRERRRFEVRLATTSPPEVSGELVAPRDLAEFSRLFGGELLLPMLVGQLDRPDWDLTVLRDDDGRAFAYARLMDLGDTTYLGGLGVEPAHRGRGFGRAVSALATRRALLRSDVVWLHCEEALGPLYASVGYELIDTHVYLGPR